MIKSHNRGVRPGLNSDLTIQSANFHVQTEDWGWRNPFIVTKVFLNGQVVKSIKSPYADILDSPIYDDRSIEEAIQRQHQKILDCLNNSQFQENCVE